LHALPKTQQLRVPLSPDHRTRSIETIGVTDLYQMRGLIRALAMLRKQASAEHNRSGNVFRGSSGNRLPA
jgi:hypothetical protein